MSSDDKKTSIPTISSNDEETNQTYTVNTDALPPNLRGKPIYLTPDFVLFPEDVAVISQIKGDDQRIFDVATSESYEIVVVFKNQVKRTVGKNEFPPHMPIATLARIIKIDRDPEHDKRYTIRGMNRVLLESATYDKESEVFRATLGDVIEVPLAKIGTGLFESQSKLRVIRQVARQILEHQTTQAARDMLRILDSDTLQPGALCDKLARTLDIPAKDRANVLNEIRISDRIEYVMHLLTQQLQVARIMAEIAQSVRADMEKQQRDYFLRQQIKAMRDQMGETNDTQTDLDELKQKVDALDASAEVKEYCDKELKRMAQMQPAGSEYGVARAHLETILDMPWNKTTVDNNDIVQARQVLDDDHFGLKEVKERLVEFLAVRALKPDLKAPIICLYGPPGVGKTSLGQSVARALGRKFHRISLGGVHDESEIRGHRRTYVASMPGRIVQALRRVQSMNPVIMLDEIDKIGSDMRGDPSSALLEVLDPEQNFAFSDNYIELPVNLSQVLFITTANNIETIPAALRDRMEIIEIPGYTSVDKHHIAHEHLIPKLLANHGLAKSHFDIKDDALETVISRYTRESGVRQLEQRLSSIMRKVATTVLEAKNNQKRPKKTIVTSKAIDSYLGKPRYDHEIAQKKAVSGVATGLAWTSCGGELLFIETTVVPGKGDIAMTGKLGDIMQESIRTAFTVLRSRAESLGIPANFLEKKDVHVHFPAGATPKDGPSAGCAIFCALMSLFTNKIVPADLAMTGEISLRGLALPIGGLREKALGAHRAGIKTVLYPRLNERDIDEIPEEVRNELTLIPVDTIDDVIKIVFADSKKASSKKATPAKAKKSKATAAKSGDAE